MRNCPIRRKRIFWCPTDSYFLSSARQTAALLPSTSQVWRCILQSLNLDWNDRQLSLCCVERQIMQLAIPELAYIDINFDDPPTFMNFLLTGRIRNAQVLRLLCVFCACLCLCIYILYILYASPLTYHVCNNTSRTLLPCNLTLVDWQFRQLPCVTTMSSLARYEFEMDTAEQRQHRHYNARLTKSGNARSKQLLVMPTESRSNREWLPGDFLSGLECQRPGWFLDMSYQTCVPHREFPL